MAKKKGNKKKGATNPTSGPQDSITLRQEITGKIQPKVSSNVKSYLNHLENLATWASGQASIPSLAAFYGQRHAAVAESSAVPPNPSLIICQRCETILQPGSNCSIRIEKNNAKRRRRSNKSSNLTQNNVAYYCHYCSFRNIKRGTPKGHMKVLYETGFESKMATEILTVDAPTIPSTTGDILTIDTPATPPTLIATTLSKRQKRKMRKLAMKLTGPDTSCAPTDAEEKTGDAPTVDAPATPPTTLGTTLLNLKKRKRKKLSSKNQTEPEISSAPTADGDKTEGTSKRKRKRKKKSWTSLKEIAQINEQSGKQNVAELAIPFSLQGTF